MGHRLFSWVKQTTTTLAVLTAGPAFGVLYSENFEVNPAAAWTVNGTFTDVAADLFFDYSSIGIPVAPSALGTRGLKLQANLSSNIFGGLSVSPNGQNFGGSYTVQFDWWANFNGPLATGGSGSTQLSTFGVGTSGTTAQRPGGAPDSIWFGATGDGNSSTDWRVYSPTPPGLYADTAAGIYAAGAFDGSSDASDPYYSSFGNEAAPAAQIALFPQQSGLTPTGSAGMTWHQVEITVDALTVRWIVDGLLIATVPIADDTVNTGNNIFFGHSDINSSSGGDPNAGALLFTLIDNIRVVDNTATVPEPGTLLVFALGLTGFVYGRRWR